MIEELLSHKLSASQESFLRKSTQGATIAAIFFVAPFVVYDFIIGEIFLGLCGTLMLAVIAYTAWNTLAGRLSYKLPFVILTPAFLAFFWKVVPELGVMGVLWCYPTLIMCYFIFPERLARVANIAMLAVVLPMSFLELESAAAFRIAATLVGVSILCMIFVRRLNAQQLELEEQASIDTLTQLSNRFGYETILDDAIEQSRVTGEPLSILLLDLDNFREINRRFGFATGDKVLQFVSAELVRSTISSDRIFRLGGDDFLILLRESDMAEAKKSAMRIYTALSTHPLKMLGHARVTLSIGVATLKPGESRYDLLQRCDTNLHRAKDSGGNAVETGALSSRLLNTRQPKV